MSKAQCPHTHRVDAHFAGRISPAEEAQMRRHLAEGCETCHFRYTRLAMVAKVQPGASAARDRIAAGLGFGRRRLPWRGSLVFGVAAAAAVLAIVFFSRDGRDRFAARGRGAAGTELRIFQVQRGGKSVPVAGRIAAADELAFAYSDGTGKRHLFVFGVDEHRHVYWFSPAWKSAGEQPAAPAIASDGALHELEDAVSHPYDGTRLDIHGLFTDHPWRVQELDAVIGGTPPGTPLSFPDGVLTTQHLEIAR
jgi:hypothetical protein